MRRQKLRKLILLLSFSVFPVTVLYLAPAPPIMSLREGIVNMSVIVLASVYLSGFILRRAFCGWICPGGGCQLVAKAVNNKPVQLKKTNWVRIIMVVVWAVMVIFTAVAAGIGRLDLFDPGGGRFADSNVRYYLPYIPVTFFMFLFVMQYGRRGFCYRGCWIYPLLAFSTLVGRRARIPSLHVSAVSVGDCSNCKACSANCPMSIDVTAFVQSRSAFPNNCIQCGTCIDTCPEKVLKYRYDSEEFRSRYPAGTAGEKAG